MISAKEAALLLPSTFITIDQIERQIKVAAPDRKYTWIERFDEKLRPILIQNGYTVSERDNSGEVRISW